MELVKNAANCVVTLPGQGTFETGQPYQVGTPYISPWSPYPQDITWPQTETGTTITVGGSLQSPNHYDIEKAENGYILKHAGKSYIYANKEDLALKIVELIG